MILEPWHAAHFRTDTLGDRLPNSFGVRYGGETKPETLPLTVFRKGTGSGTIKGTMTFERKDYGRNNGVPFSKIADRVEVTVDLKAKRVSGPPVALKP